MTLLERYQKMRPPVFIGGNDGIAAEIWKKDIKRILMTLGASPVQM